MVVCMPSLLKPWVQTSAVASDSEEDKRKLTGFWFLSNYDKHEFNTIRIDLNFFMTYLLCTSYDVE
jgi:hypothetical protein